MGTIPIPQKQKKTASLKNDLLVVSLCLKQPYLGVVVGAKTTSGPFFSQRAGLIESIAVVDTSDEARLSAKSADLQVRRWKELTQISSLLQHPHNYTHLKH